MQETELNFVEYVQGCIESISPNMGHDEIESILKRVTEMLGFDHYSLMTGGVFGGQEIRGWEGKRPHRFINFDKNFVDEYSINRLEQHDLILKRGMNAWQPFQWSSIYKTTDLNNGQILLQELSADFGMRDGVIFPTQGFGDDISLFSLSTARDTYHCHMSIVVQSLILMLINKIHFSIKAKYVREHFQDDKKLSARELDVLYWLKEGKTQWEVSQILGISEHTVDTHLRRAKAKLNVSTKEQAIAKTITIRMMEPI